MEFINDEAVIGKWKNIGWLNSVEDFGQEELNTKSGEFDELYFLPEGEAYWIFEGWTKGSLLIHYGGDEPILTYSYMLRHKNGEDYLLLFLKEKVEVFIKINSNIYEKETLGRHDDIDLEFVEDKQVVGKWKSVDIVDKVEVFTADKKKEDLYLQAIEFFNDGSVKQEYMDEIWKDKYTKGIVINRHRKTAASYI